MARINHSVKCTIVRALAAFETPGQVAKAIKAEYGIDVSPQQVEAYDPTKRAGAGLSADLRTLFETERKKAKAQIDEVPIAHKAVRLRKLDRAADRAEACGNYGLVLKILEQAAKEMGGSFEAKRQVEVTSKDGGQPQVGKREPFDTETALRAALGCFADEEYLQDHPN